MQDSILIASHIILPRENAGGYGPLEVLDRTSRFLCEQRWSVRHCYVQGCLGGDEEHSESIKPSPAAPQFGQISVTRNLSIGLSHSYDTKSVARTSVETLTELPACRVLYYISFIMHE